MRLGGDGGKLANVDCTRADPIPGCTPTGTAVCHGERGPELQMSLIIGGGLVVTGLAIAVYVLTRPGRGLRRENREESSVDTGVRPATPPHRKAAVPGPRPSVHEVRWVVPAGGLNPAYRPTWFAFVPGRFVMGPYDKERSAEGAASSPDEVAHKIAVDPEQTSASIEACGVRSDLSTPPYYVFEFRCGDQVFYSIIGPNGWESPTTTSEHIIRLWAERLASFCGDDTPSPGEDPDKGRYKS